MLTKLEREACEQLWVVTYDGDLISKTARDHLVDLGLAQRGHGYQWLTAAGVRLVIDWKVARGDGDPVNWRKALNWAASGSSRVSAFTEVAGGTRT